MISGPMDGDKATPIEGKGTLTFYAEIQSPTAAASKQYVKIEQPDVLCATQKPGLDGTYINPKEVKHFG